ncbi:MAG: hypothetical protein CSA66_00465 [Proteobacteria bacterium]|nr:MAG: hypothetical protein CSA66_00465 [Pseudomonadota bacterium]
MTLQDIADALDVTTRSARRYLKQIHEFEFELEQVPSTTRALLWRVKPVERPRARRRRRGHPRRHLHPLRWPGPRPRPRQRPRGRRPGLRRRPHLRARARHADGAERPE